MKILVIDDDLAMTDLLKVLLAPTGALILAALSGQDGLEQIAKHNPEIIILDLMMPEVDGWQVCHKVRETSKTPILILSALDNPGTVASALDAGADDYLIKPVTSGVLIAHINKLVRRNWVELGLRSLIV
jgi:DNA-binding response OmpR family regulator